MRRLAEKEQSYGFDWQEYSFTRNIRTRRWRLAFTVQVITEAVI